MSSDETELGGSSTMIPVSPAVEDGRHSPKLPCRTLSPKPSELSIALLTQLFPAGFTPQVVSPTGGANALGATTSPSEVSALSPIVMDESAAPAPAPASRSTATGAATGRRKMSLAELMASKAKATMAATIPPPVSPARSLPRSVGQHQSPRYEGMPSPTRSLPRSVGQHQSPRYEGMSSPTRSMKYEELASPLHEGAGSPMHRGPGSLHGSEFQLDGKSVHLPIPAVPHEGYAPVPEAPGMLLPPPPPQAEGAYWGPENGFRGGRAMEEMLERLAAEEQEKKMLNKRLGDALRSLGAEEARSTALLRRATHAEQSISQAEMRLLKREGEEGAWQEERHELESRAYKLGAEALHASEQVQRLEASLAQLQQQSDRSNRRADQIRKEARELEEEARRAHQDSSRLGEQVRHLEAQLASARDAAAWSESRATRAEDQVAELREEVARLKRLQEGSMRASAKASSGVGAALSPVTTDGGMGFAVPTTQGPGSTRRSSDSNGVRGALVSAEPGWVMPDTSVGVSVPVIGHPGGESSPAGYSLSQSAPLSLGAVTADRLGNPTRAAGKDAEKALMELNLEKTELEAELAKLLDKPQKSIKGRNRVGEVEERLWIISKEASALRMELKRQPA
ncbi:unnamed protein product [Chrysoparadoxa australica]